MQLILLSKIEIPPSIRPRPRIIGFARYIQKINWNCDDSYNFASFQSERNNRILKRIPKNPINFVEKFRIVHENEDRRQREFKPRRSRIASRINNYFVIVYTDQGFVRQN